jgi:hypothetical protein
MTSDKVHIAIVELPLYRRSTLPPSRYIRNLTDGMSIHVIDSTRTYSTHYIYDEAPEGFLRLNNWMVLPI